VVHSDSPDEALHRGADSTGGDYVGDVGDIGSLFFTSGTTGASKAVATTWHYLFTTAATVASAWEFGPGEVLWTAMPLFHLSAAPAVLAPMLVGGTTALAPAFHPGSVWDQVRACGAVGFAGAGAMVSMLWKQPPDPRDAQLPLRFVSAAPIDAAVYRGIEQRYGCRIVTMYGLTEAFPIAVKGVPTKACQERRVGPTPVSRCGLSTRTASRSRTIGGRDRLSAPLPTRHERGLRERLGPGRRPAPAVVSHRGPRCARR